MFEPPFQPPPSFWGLKRPYTPPLANLFFHCLQEGPHGHRIALSNRGGPLLARVFSLMLQHPSPHQPPVGRCISALVQDHFVPAGPRSGGHAGTAMPCFDRAVVMRDKQVPRHRPKVNVESLLCPISPSFARQWGWQEQPRLPTTRG